MGNTKLLRAAAMAALFVFGAGSAAADEIRLDLNGHSWHASKPPAWPAHDWNQNNAGIGVQYITKLDAEGWRSRYTAGTMRDSLGVDGEYIGVGRDFPWEGESFKASAGWMVMMIQAKSFMWRRFLWLLLSTRQQALGLMQFLSRRFHSMARSFP